MKRYAKRDPTLENYPGEAQVHLLNPYRRVLEASGVSTAMAMMANGSWSISGLRRSPRRVVIVFTLLITPLITTHEPPRTRRSGETPLGTSGGFGKRGGILSIQGPFGKEKEFQQHEIVANTYPWLFCCDELVKQSSSCFARQNAVPTAQ